MDRQIEFLPDDDRDRPSACSEGRGLSSPELSVLLAWSKIALTDDLMATNVDQDTGPRRCWRDTSRRICGRGTRTASTSIPLRKEIVITMLANDIVNHGGITFVHRVDRGDRRLGGGDRPGLRRRRQIFDLDGIWEEIQSLDRAAPTAAQNELYLEIRRLLDRSVRWVLTTRGGVLDVSKTDRGRAPGGPRPDADGDRLPARPERQRLAGAHAAEFVALGAPEPLAHAGGRLPGPVLAAGHRGHRRPREAGPGVRGASCTSRSRNGSGWMRC